MILEAIYNGDFYPRETVVPKSEKYRNALRACEKIMNQLAQRLTKEDYDLVETLLDQSSIVQCEESECHFKVGFSAGLLVQQEAEKQVKSNKQNNKAKAAEASERKPLPLFIISPIREVEKFTSAGLLALVFISSIDWNFSCKS